MFFSVVFIQAANKTSIFFYLQLKGETESDLISLNLFPKCLAIYRPATLLCSRVESRLTERAFQILLKPFAYLAPTLLTTIDILAKAMTNAPFSSKLKTDLSVQQEKSLPKNVYIFENSDIFLLASENKDI
ncbi:Oxidoreductase HTATIP2, putative [Schistosoma mansoni]|uniref:Oxidoreductase HTATIP2, putative n=1 Tax=Schistosoma mansoni TaxID=6183 RepID=UPI00022C843D|nr:Oxidoreductase HTATIP2, putative [Schistosoma mansoni]|eukprot:XP_018647282.1 Oxidoreductase HTATIP2, putative [Schistosoma mansoni]